MGGFYWSFACYMTAIIFGPMFAVEVTVYAVICFRERKKRVNA